jgi:hypothetical protein
VLVLLLLLKTVLESVLIKKFVHIRKKIHLLTTTRVRSRLAYPKNAKFPYVFYLPRSHRAHEKEHMQTRKSFPFYF